MTVRPISLQRAKLLVSTEKNLGYPASLAGDGQTVVYQAGGKKGELYRLKEGQSQLIATDVTQWSDVSADGDTVYFAALDQEESVIKRWRPGGLDVVQRGPESILALDVDDSGTKVAWEDMEVDSKFERAYWSDAFLHSENDDIEKLSSQNKGSYTKISGNGERVVWRELPPGEGEHFWTKSGPGPSEELHLPVKQLRNWEIDNSGELLVLETAQSSTSDLYLHSIGSGQVIPIGTEPCIDEFEPCLSGDGKTVAYSARHLTGDSRIRIYRDGQTFEVQSQKRGYSSQPQLSDDGNTLIWNFSEFGSDTRQIYKLDTSALETELV